MDLVLRNKYKLEGLQLSGTLKETIDGVAYTMDVTIVKNYDLANNVGISKGDAIEFWDYLFSDSTNKKRLFCGVVWDIQSSDKTFRIDMQCKERTLYMEESEDEFNFKEGQTATTRIKDLCNAWGIPIGNIPDTKTSLSKDRKKCGVYSAMWEALKETAQKGGKLYNFRFDDSLSVIELGSNQVIYKIDDIIDEPSRSDTMQGVVTQVKVLGENKSKDDAPTLSPVIGTYKQYTDYYGTIQKVVQDSKIENYSQGQERANTMFSAGDDTWTFKCVKDILDIRAGDKVSLSGREFYVIDITHQLGDQGMIIKAMETLDNIRSKFYGK